MACSDPKDLLAEIRHIRSQIANMTDLEQVFHRALGEGYLEDL